LGKSSGWVHRASLKDKRVEMIGGVQYDRIDDHGLHITVKEKQRVLAVDRVVVCAGQDPLRELEAGLKLKNKRVHLIGGANVASELDAKRAILEATKLAAAV
jgi:2,4-dienoyl-CoA reductase (NADPH2)